MTKKIFAAVLIKFCLLFIVYCLASFFLPYKGGFPYKDILLEYGLPAFLTRLANFDGVHYILIARGGYLEYQQAFFPLYPLLIRFLAPVFLNNYLLAGLFISNFCFFLGLVFLDKLSKLVFPKNILSLISYFLFLLLFPASFFFHALYNESLFLLLFVSALYYLKKKNYLLAGVLAALSSATRLIGVFLFIPFLFELYPIFSKNFPKKNRLLYVIRYTLYVLFPFIGLFSYMLYLYFTTGDPLFFFNSQPAYGANRSTHLILLPQVYWRYFKIFTSAALDITYFVSLVEFVLFNLIFLTAVLELLKQWKKKNYFLTGLALFSVINILLPTFTGTLSSIPRYSLFSFSSLLFLAGLKSRTIRLATGGLFLVLQVVLFALFIQGYFVS